MAALPTTRATMAHLKGYLDPQGKVTPVVEYLAQNGEKELEGYLEWQPGNLPTGHEFPIRTALPTAYLRDYNEFVAPSVSAVGRMTEGMSIHEAWCDLDFAEINLNGEAAAYRAQEGIAFMQAMRQAWLQNFIYGNQKNSAKECNGLATRLSTLASGNVIDCGGDAATTNTSIYALQPGPDVFGIYPKGSPIGLQHVDFGDKQVLTDSTGKKMRAATSQYVWNCGMVVRHPLRIGRIANIKVADLRAGTGTQATTASTNVIDAMSDMLHAINAVPGGNGNIIFLAPPQVVGGLAKMGRKMAINAVDVVTGLTQFGKNFRQVQFLGAPVIPVDRILLTESKVV